MKKDKRNPYVYDLLYMYTKRQRIPKGQSKKDNPKKLATQGTQQKEKKQNKTQHNMRWTPLYPNKHK